MDNNHSQKQECFGYQTYPENYIYQQQETSNHQYDSNYWDNYFFVDENEEYRFMNRET